MSKKTRKSPQRKAADATAGPNPRQPCPCGSGKRYKACHGAGDDVIVLDPFRDLAAAPDLIAMREFVPSALAPLTLADAGKKLAGDRTAQVATVLPNASAALVRGNGEALIGMQVQTRTGDISTDLGRALRWALTAEPGEQLPVAGAALGDPVRLQDLLVADAPLDVSVHTDFSWWLDPGTEATPEMTATLERANSVIMPTDLVRADGVRSAYWTDTGEKAHIRWLRPEPEDRLLPALARLLAREQLDLGEGSRFVGAFRAHGLLVPVWDVDKEMHVKEWSAPAEAFATRLAEALASLDSSPVTDAERRARDSIIGRQVTLR